MSLLFGIPLALAIMLWQLYYYEKFNSVSQTDLLESVHQHTLDNNEETWETIRAKIHNGFEKYTIEEDHDGYIVINLKRFLIPSVLKVIRQDNYIKITIERTFFNFMPDSAKNYKTLKKLLHKLN
ncbi:hypothetical protein NBRC110019_25130 [Neptunitalea chrysea]|uniref:Uncharacterized protein n=2 Tax=Neptunitalea chrysea TaxID=1647581 RepID=A0A9W6B8F5_9FLAO|nr:hypothetical protein NBRC110019_25130 [Neptunitalea chrysea]